VPIGRRRPCNRGSNQPARPQSSCSSVARVIRPMPAHPHDQQHPAPSFQSRNRAPRVASALKRAPGSASFGKPSPKLRGPRQSPLRDPSPPKARMWEEWEAARIGNNPKTRCPQASAAVGGGGGEKKNNPPRGGFFLPLECPEPAGMLHSRQGNADPGSQKHAMTKPKAFGVVSAAARQASGAIVGRPDAGFQILPAFGKCHQRNGCQILRSGSIGRSIPCVTVAELFGLMISVPFPSRPSVGWN